MAEKAVGSRVAADLARQWDEYFDKLEEVGASPLDLASLHGPGSKHLRALNWNELAIGGIWESKLNLCGGDSRCGGETGCG